MNPDRAQLCLPTTDPAEQRRPCGCRGDGRGRHQVGCLLHLKPCGCRGGDLAHGADCWKQRCGCPQGTAHGASCKKRQPALVFGKAPTPKATSSTPSLLPLLAWLAGGGLGDEAEAPRGNDAGLFTKLSRAEIRLPKGGV